MRVVIHIMVYFRASDQTKGPIIFWVFFVSTTSVTT